jgi:hypothetical protein
VFVDGVPLSVADLSGWGAFLVLAFLVIVGFMTGRVQSSRALKAEKERGDTFQRAYERAMQASENKDQGNAELLENSRTTVRMLRAIQQASERAAHHASEEGPPG